MEHKTFGKIVAALRQEQINLANGNSWSQTDLAEETGLTPGIVGRIERGQQASTTTALLLAEDRKSNKRRRSATAALGSN